jgi:hypothetical protein
VPSVVEPSTKVRVPVGVGPAEPNETEMTTVWVVRAGFGLAVTEMVGV